MGATAAAEKSLREGDVVEALKALQLEVRAQPADAKLRTFLFQLLAVMGQWERALDQLNVAATLDPAALAMAQVYREALHCELLRADVFAGKRSPMVLGQPEEWLALLIESALQAGRGQTGQAARLRERAFEAAPASPGTIDGAAFEWIGDADMRLGPVLEAIVNGRYYWIAFNRLRRVHIEAPADLRDVVWMPAQFEFANGGQSVGLIPTRYPGCEASNDGAVCLARKTLWNEVSLGVFHGLGQRLLATDQGEYALMDVRRIELTASEVAAEAAAEGPGG